ncbi:MAG TPA: hypothetical protein VM165_22365 [Planctomycetaceae bacterium]|nr:hypothetical protein [Planctomycetaceae bacterium]
MITVVCGCGGGEFETAPVRGTVSCEGTPVTSGTITFSPIAEGAVDKPGKPGMGKIGSDGTFVLTTYKEGDGAIIGMHEVFYAPAIAGEGDEDEEGGGPAKPAAPAKRPTGKVKLLPCQLGGTARIGVVDGKNDLKIELSSWIPKKDDEEEDRRGE